MNIAFIIIGYLLIGITFFVGYHVLFGKDEPDLGTPGEVVFCIFAWPVVLFVNLMFLCFNTFGLLLQLLTGKKFKK